MRARRHTLEQLLPFATAGELIDTSRQKLVSTSPEVTAREALAQMEKHDIGFLPVLEDGRLVGVVSERDLARGLLHCQTLVHEVMTEHVHTVAPETNVPACLMLMHREHVRHLPVVSGEALLGVLSIRDLTGSLIDRHERLLRRLHDERLTLLFPFPSSY